MTSEQIGEKGFVGLPPNLVQKDEDDSPRVFSLMPGLNRRRRRGLASRMRSLRSIRLLVGRMNDTDAILKVFRQPGHRYSAFWIELEDGPPPADEYKTSLFMTVDYWLLRDFEPHLDKLEPPADAEMLKHCPPWAGIRESLLEQLKRIRAKPDLRYFALWPRILDEVANWQNLPEATRIKVANATFALSSISGDPWFVDELQRLCSSAAPYFEGLRRQDRVTEESKENGETDADVETETEPLDEGDAVEPSCSPFDWQALGVQLRSIGERLEAGARDPALAEALDDLWVKYEALKEQQPLRAPAREMLQKSFGTFESFVREIGESTAAGMIDASAIVAGWRAAVEASGDDETCIRLQRDLEQAESKGRAADEQLVAARAALSSTATEHTRLQAQESSATDWNERRMARRTLGEIESRLSELRQKEELAEEDLIAAIVPPQSGPFPGERIPETPPPVSGNDAVTASQAEAHSPTATVDAPGTPAEKEEILTALPEAGLVEESPQDLADAEEPDVSPQEPAETELPLTAKPASGGDTGSAVSTGFTTETGNLCAPIWQALRKGEVALAYHAASAIRQIAPDTPLPSPALLSVVALGRRLQSPGGPIAESLRRNFAEIDRNDFEIGGEDWRLANNLLLSAACLRPLILAPDTGASGVVQYVHLGAGLEPVFEVQRLLGEYGQRMKGNRLDAAALGAIRSKAAWDAEFGRLQRDLEQWVERAPRFTVKFRAATEVWRRWISQDGAIGRLTGLLYSTGPGALSEIRELCDTFRSSASFRALVDETDRRQLKRMRGEDIHAAAYEQLRQKAEEAVVLGERWVSLMEAQPSQADYLSRQLGELQGHLAKAGQEALEVLQSPVDEDPWGLLTAARVTLRDTLAGLLELFTGTHGTLSPEPRPEVIMGEALLYTGRVSLDAEWRPEGPPQHLLDAVKSHLVRPGSVREAVESFAAAGDLSNAQRLVDVMDTDAEDREELTRVVERALVRSRDEFRAESRQVDEEVSLALAYSLIGPSERVDLALRVAGLEIGHAANQRFDLCRQVLKEIVAQIAERRSARAADLKRRLADLEALHPEHDYGLISAAIAEGDFPVATEYLHRVEQDPAAALTAATARDLFNDFFPARCRQLHDLCEKLDATAIRRVIQERLNASSVSFGHLSTERAKAAASTWTLWTKLRTTRAPTIEMLRTLFLSLGFRDAVVSTSNRPAGRVREYQLVMPPLSDREICQSPHFGSRTEGRYRIACLWDPPGQEDYRQLAGDATTGLATIALYFGALPEQKRRELSALSRGERRQSFLLIDDLLLLFICGEEDSPLAALFQSCLPFTYSDPFVTTSSVMPPEMFFGRASELAAIKAMDGACFVYGGRQLGKTALLRQAEREFHNPAERRISVWLDLKRLARPDEIWVPIWREFRKHGIVSEKVAEPRRTERSDRRIDDFVHALEHWIREHPDHRVLLLLDEADRFLEYDARNGFPDTHRLKALMETEGAKRRFKVVFAGLHNVLRTTEQANQPLAHLGQGIEIGPLIQADDLRAARELVLRPLMAAGFAFESERRADRILALTNYYPSLIQLYCSKLLNELLRNGGAALDRRAGPRYPITARHLDSVYARNDLRDEIRSKFLLTLKLDARYNLITYALAYEMQQGKLRLETGATVEEIRRIAEAWWMEGFESTAEPAFRVLLQEMVGLGVLRDVQQGRFTLRNPNVLLLLGSATEIGEELLRERELPMEYEPRVYRMALSADPTGSRRSPLTVSQVADVVARENGVVVLAGSEAAGVREVQDAVHAATETGFFSVMEAGDSGGLSAFQRTLDKLGDRKTGGTTVLFVGPDCPWSASWVQHARSRVERLKSEKNPVRVVFVADPTTLRVVLNEGLPDAVPIISLEPWRDAFLREWLEETTRGSESSVRKAILEQTGGWPEFVYEWRADSVTTIDTDGEARRRLARLGVEDAHALSAVDDQPIESLCGGPEGGAAAQLVRWAELLGLVRIGGDAKVHVDPWVAELIMRV